MCVFILIPIRNVLIINRRLTAVKAHKATVVSRERDLALREAAIAEKESKLTGELSQKDSEIISLRNLLASAESAHQARVRNAVLAREEELRTLAARKEAELAATLAMREQEIMAAVNRREQEASKMWAEWAAGVKAEALRLVDERMEWVQRRGHEIEEEWERLESLKGELERRAQELELAEKKAVGGSTKAKTPLEEVKNILAPLAQLTGSTGQQTPPRRRPKWSHLPFETPGPREASAPAEPFSAMKGVILTSTGETLPTPSPAEIANLFVATPKVSLNFTQIFDFDSDAEDSDRDDDKAGYETDTNHTGRNDSLADLEATPTQTTTATVTVARPTRLRRPSIRATERKPSLDRLVKGSVSTSSSRKPRQPSPPLKASFLPSSSQRPPEYDLSDEENLPSPFLKKVDRQGLTRTMSVPSTSNTANSTALRNAPRKSGNSLRALAVVNAARGVNGRGGTRTGGSRPSIAKAQKVGEEARKALARS